MKLRNRKPGIEILIGSLVLILGFQNCDVGMHGEEGEMLEAVPTAFDAIAPETCEGFAEGETWFHNRGIEDVPKSCPAGSTGSIVQHIMMQDQYRCMSNKAVGTGVSRQADITGQDVNCWSTGPGGSGLPEGGTISCGTHAPGTKWWIDSGSTYEVAANCPHGGNLINIYMVEVEKYCANGVVSNTNSSRTTTLKGTRGSCNGAPTPTPTPGTTPTPSPTPTDRYFDTWIALQDRGTKTASQVCGQFNMAPATSAGGLKCASGENPNGASEIYTYTYSVNVGGHDSGITRTYTYYECYSPGQKKDHDGSDRVTHYLCRTYY